MLQSHEKELLHSSAFGVDVLHVHVYKFKFYITVHCIDASDFHRVVFLTEMQGGPKSRPLRLPAHIHIKIFLNQLVSQSYFVRL